MRKELVVISKESMNPDDFKHYRRGLMDPRRIPDAFGIHGTSAKLAREIFKAKKLDPERLRGIWKEEPGFNEDGFCFWLLNRRREFLDVKYGMNGFFSSDALEAHDRAFSYAMLARIKALSKGKDDGIGIVVFEVKAEDIGMFRIDADQGEMESGPPLPYYLPVGRFDEFPMRNASIVVDGGTGIIDSDQARVQMAMELEFTNRFTTGIED